MKRVDSMNARGKRILVVDDHSTLSTMLGEMLQVLGHRPEVFTSAAPALAWLDTETPDLAFLDIQMPGIHGVDLLEAVRVRGHTFPVIIITANPADPLAAEAREMGVVAVISKPVSIDQLQGLAELNPAAMRPKAAPALEAGAERPGPSRRDFLVEE